MQSLCRFHYLLEVRARSLIQSDYHVLIVGDLNVAHRLNDHCEGHLIENFENQPHRVWMSKLLQEDFVDAFRFFHPHEERAYTVWNTQVIHFWAWTLYSSLRLVFRVLQIM